MKAAPSSSAVALPGLGLGVGEHQLGAFLGEALGDALADAARRADDQRDLAVEPCRVMRASGGWSA